MTTLTIPKKEAENIVNEYHHDWESISKTIKDQSRWSTRYSGIFKKISTNKHYKVSYSKGSTENQEYQDLFYDDNIEFLEVEEREVLVKQWVAI